MCFSIIIGDHIDLDTKSSVLKKQSFKIVVFVNIQTGGCPFSIKTSKLFEIIQTNSF